MDSLLGKLLNTKNKAERHSDADLIALICGADEIAFEELYRRLYTRLFRFIARMTRRTDLVDEIINDVMYVVWMKAGTYDGRSKVSTWILGIAYNKARQALRDNHYANEESLDDMIEHPFDSADHDALSTRLELTDWLESALDTLSADQRAVIDLTYYQGCHYSEIAALMGCPENTVKTRMHHARKKLALALKEH